MCRVSCLGARNEYIGVKICHGNHHATFEDSILDSDCNCANHLHVFLCLSIAKTESIQNNFISSLNLMEFSTYNDTQSRSITEKGKRTKETYMDFKF